MPVIRPYPLLRQFAVRWSRRKVKVKVRRMTRAPRVATISAEVLPEDLGLFQGQSQRRVR